MFWIHALGNDLLVYKKHSFIKSKSLNYRGHIFNAKASHTPDLIFKTHLNGLDTTANIIEIRKACDILGGGFCLVYVQIRVLVRSFPLRLRAFQGCYQNKTTHIIMILFSQTLRIFTSTISKFNEKVSGASF